MLVNVAVDQDALDFSAESGLGWQRTAGLSALATQLMNTGVLVLPDAGAVTRIRDWATGLPPNLSKKWEAFLRMGASAVVAVDEPWSPPIEESESLEDLCLSLTEKASVVVLHDDRADLLGFSAAEFARELAAIEFVRLTAIASSGTFAAAAKPRHMAKGQPRNEFWDEYLEVPTSRVRHLTVVDRYAGVNLVQHLLLNKDGRSGPAWFLKRVADRERPPKVRIYTRLSHPTSNKQERCGQAEIAEALEVLHRRYPGTAAMALEMCLLYPDAGPHDRHVRFGDRVFLSLGNGLASFNAQRASDTFTFARISAEEAHAREREARDGVAARVSPAKLRMEAT